MDEQKPENQSQPIFQTVVEPEPINEPHIEPQGEPPQVPLSPNVVPEEIAEETPNELTEQDIEIGSGGSGGAFNIPPIDESTFGGGGFKKYIFIGLGVFLALILFATIFSFLMKLTGGNKQAITLEYWGLWEEEQIYKPLIEAYKRENPNITINYIKQDPKNYREKLLSRSSEGRGPDIFRFHNTWLPSIAEIASPIPSSVMTKEQFETTFYQVTQDDVRIGDEYYGLPLGIDGLILVYNNELFTGVNITTPPQTWKDVIDAANELRVVDAEGNLITSGIALGTSENIEHSSDIFGWLLLQNGASLSDLTAPEAVDTLRNYRQFAESQFNFWSENMPNNITAFIQGKVGMIIVPSWHIINIRAANPDLQIKTAALPILPGNQPLSLANYWIEGVSRASKNQNEAWKFLEFLTRKENMEKLYAEQAKLRPFGQPYSRVDLREKLIENEYIGPVLVQAPFMKSLPTVSRTFDNGINDEINTYIKGAVNSAMLGVDYSESMKTASQGVQQVLTKYNIK